MKIIYCGFDFFSECLKTLVSLGHEVQAAYSFEADNLYAYNDYMEAICQNTDIPFSLDRISGSDIERFEREGCELLLSAGYLHKIPPLESTSIRGVNIHPSLLPVGRGRWPLPWTLLKNLSSSGITYHKITQQFDAGDILLQREFELADSENLETLSAKYQMLAARSIEELMADFDEYWNEAKPQSGEAQYWPLPTEDDRTLDWDASGEEILRRSRAFGKHGCKGFFNNQWWMVFELSVWKAHHDTKPGETVHLTNTETIVACKDGYACLRYFKPM